MVKQALLIGITYTGSDKYLKGCANDLVSMVRLLNSWGFTNNNIIILAEKPVDGYIGHISSPTAANINNALNNFVKRLSIMDKAIIYYSGHGMIMKSKDKNKRVESCIVPLDHKKMGVINSESIRYYLNKISAGVNILNIFDCCNSGTVCDLKYHTYDTSFRKDITVKLRKYDTNDWNIRQIQQIGQSGSGSSFIDTEANIISISGCWDDSVSYDLGKNGALTLAILNYLNSQKIIDITIKDLLQGIRGNLINLRVSQTPQLMTGKDIDLELKLKQFLDL